MIDKCLEVASQYDVVVNKAVRGRGAVILDTDKGPKKMYEYSGTENRLKYEYELLNYIKGQGYENVDNIVKTREDEFVAKDEFGTMFVMKDWFLWKECNVRNEQDILAGAQALATLHNITKDVKEVSQSAVVIESPVDEYKRHNAELKRVRNYIRSKKHKVEFEYDILRHFDEYYSYAMEAGLMLEKTAIDKLVAEAEKIGTICHGNYNYHNIMFMGEKAAVLGFERSGKGVLVKDLYFYMRKVLEKYDWDLMMGYNILERYNKIRTLSSDESKILKVMLMYPEKFWKVLNHYYNGNKSWIPDKNIEKLKGVYASQTKKEEFITKIWAD